MATYFIQNRLHHNWGKYIKLGHVSLQSPYSSNKMQQQRRSGSLPSQRQDDEAQYRRLLAKYADILDNEKGTSSQSLISTLLSWLFLRRTISPSSIYTCGQGFFRMAGKLAKPAAKLAKGMPALACAVLFGFISAVGLTWCWWYVRRNCVWIIYRLLLYDSRPLPTVSLLIN